MDSKKCPICDDEARVEDFQIIRGELFVTCKYCGKIHFDLSASQYLESCDGYRFRACLYYYFTHYVQSQKLYFIHRDENKHDESQYTNKSFDEIMSLYPKTISERIDKILMNFAKLSNKVGDYIDICSEKSFLPVTFSEIPTESEFIFLVMNDMKLVSKPSSWGFNPLKFKILYKGWQRIDELQKQFKTKNQGFIAMWFDPSMKEIEKAIKEAIIETGYLHMKIDEKEHNNQIVPEILYEIRNSDFIVADLTENRGGVYYEAGYALGIGKEVIVSVNVDKEKPHFDVAQKSQVRYKTPEELKKKLINRITATVGDRNNQIK